MKKLGAGIGFDDSEFKCCEINKKENGYDVIAYLNSWDGHLIKIVFFNTILFSFRSGYDVEGLFEMDEDEFFKKAISIGGEEETSDSKRFKKFSLIDIDDVEFIEVVAKGVVVTKEENM